MAKYIMQILRTQPITVMSWGAHNFTAITDGLVFKVQGYKHKGWVEIKYNVGTDYFDVRLLTPKSMEKKRISDVDFESLVDVIDHNVELVDGYEQRVKETYNIY